MESIDLDFHLHHRVQHLKSDRPILSDFKVMYIDNTIRAAVEAWADERPALAICVDVFPRGRAFLGPIYSLLNQGAGILPHIAPVKRQCREIAVRLNFHNRSRETLLWYVLYIHTI